MGNTCSAYTRQADKNGNHWVMENCSGANCPLGHLGANGEPPACPHLASLIDAKRLLEGGKEAE